MSGIKLLNRLVCNPQGIISCEHFNHFFRGNGFPRFKSRKNPVQSIRIANNTNTVRIEKQSLEIK